MSHSGQHCPFLNRTDPRCSAHFSLDELGYALGYCFGSYHACPVYLELLLERQVRRARGQDAFVQADGSPLVQITIARGARNDADPAVVSHASGV